MNILVTGGAGYIGSHTCVELLNSGYDVTVIDNLCNANPKSLERVEAITGRKVKFYEGDVRDEALLRKIFAENEISAVIHFAGLKAVGESVAQPWRYYDNNLNTTLVLTKVMADVGCKKIIFSSSATVYSGDNEMPLRETSRTGNCTNPYGTEQGQLQATQVYERHVYFKNQLLHAGVEPVLAEEEACRMEHTISEESFKKLKGSKCVRSCIDCKGDDCK